MLELSPSFRFPGLESPEESQKIQTDETRMTNKALQEHWGAGSRSTFSNIRHHTRQPHLISFYKLVISIALVFSFKTTELNLRIHPAAAASSAASLHLVQRRVSFPSTPRYQSKLTTLFNHKFCLLCPVGFPSYEI